MVGRTLRVLRSRRGGVVIAAVGGAAAAVDVDHVSVLDRHRANALLVSMAAHDLQREIKKCLEEAPYKRNLR